MPLADTDTDADTADTADTDTDTAETGSGLGCDRDWGGGWGLSRSEGIRQAARESSSAVLAWGSGSNCSSISAEANSAPRSLCCAGGKAAAIEATQS
eukprot:CAMPEP_0173185720 /NCGR_PEP_ID=MMETSP1141-20130122/9721_1 /TAXON_ID=483371 /ORGANISM="non described non described, Strain CCMP2298" /LENGTH=96 /DNA_ID=CAMNT_0014109299 /DNA_START=169 /DNA_END=459 /DNA_ORIENTATION=-